MYGPQRAERELGAIVRTILPAATGQETRLIGELVQGRALSFGLGLAGTLLSVTAILGSIDTAISHILGREGKRPFVRGRLNGLAFVALIIALAAASFAVTVGVEALVGALGPRTLRPLRPLVAILSALPGLAVGYWSFYLVFRLAPRRPVGRPAARRAALVSAVLWELAKVAFGFLTRALGVFEAYGALAFAAGLLTWIYVTAAIILIGAEVARTRNA